LDNNSQDGAAGFEVWLGGMRLVGAGEGDEADVVFLTEALGGVGEGGGREVVVEVLLDAVEAEELAVGVGGFEDAVGDEDELVVGG
jgi:hypothetical protein